MTLLQTGHFAPGYHQLRTDTLIHKQMDRPTDCPKTNALLSDTGHEFSLVQNIF